MPRCHHPEKLAIWMSLMCLGNTHLMASPPADRTGVHHCGAGRTAPLNMRPRSLWEPKMVERYSVSVGLVRPWRRVPVEQESGVFTLDEVAHLLCRGGWPIALCWHRRGGGIEIIGTAVLCLRIVKNELFRNKKAHEVLKNGCAEPCTSCFDGDGADSCWRCLKARRWSVCGPHRLDETLD